MIHQINKNFAVILLFFLALTGIDCSGDSDSDNPGRNPGNSRRADTTTVEAIEVKRSDIAQQIRSYGNIQSKDVVIISPQVSDRITELHVDLGDTVEQGDLMAKINEQTYREQLQSNLAQMRQARAAMRRDSAEFARQKRLFKKDMSSSSEFETAQSNYRSSKASYEAAQSSVEQSRENLRHTEVRAPVYGVVVSRNVAEGDVVSSGQTLFELANLLGYEARLHLPMEEWEQATAGQQVTFRMSSSRNEVIARGRVSRKSPRLDSQTGLGEVVITLTEKTRQIHQGMLIEANINVKQHDDAVVIPRSALIEKVQTVIEPESNTIELTRDYSVFVAQGDTIAKRRKLELGLEQGDRVEVQDGLEAGEKLIITGQKSLTDDTPVKIAAPQEFEQGDIPVEREADTLDSSS